MAQNPTIMTGSNILTFDNNPSDLSSYEEHWLSETIAEREVRVLSDIRAWHIKDKKLETEERIKKLEEESPYALLPSKNIRFIRDVVFPVDEDVTVGDLVDIIPKIRERFVIDGFQAAIDRDQQMAHMVFDWFDRSNGHCVYLYPNKRVRFSVFLVRELGLPRPEGYEMWLRHFLLQDYKSDPQIFNRLTEHIKHLKLGRRGYVIVRDALQYTELVCKNLIR